MSTILNGEYKKNDLCANARGGTEMMAERLVANVGAEWLRDVQIYVSRPDRSQRDPSKKQILWCHDLIGDPEMNGLLNGGHAKYDMIVFVSYWQRDQFMLAYNIPPSKCTVIENAVSRPYVPANKPSDKINFIYHTTPHRGLALLYPIFDALASKHDNLHLDVFSSFEVYGWKERDKDYHELFEKLRSHANITYHGAQPNDVVLDALSHAHVFLYPSIWKETSCIALIEAIRSDVLCIHPTLAALPETASERTVMYDYTEDSAEHMQRAFKAAEEIVRNGPGEIGRVIRGQSNDIKRHSIESFTTSWKHVIARITR